MKIPFLALTLLLAAGCGGGTTSETASTRATPDTGFTATAMDTSPSANAPPGQGVVVAPVVPAAEPRDIWEQIRAQLADLNAAIGAGRLGEVHDRAHNLNQLVAALDGKVPAAQAGRLRQVAAEVAVVADRMHEAADTGNLTGTKQQFAALEEKMKDVEALTHHAP